MSIAIYEAVHAGDDALANSLVLIASAVCITLLVLASYSVRRGVTVSCRSDEKKGCAGRAPRRSPVRS